MRYHVQRGVGAEGVFGELRYRVQRGVGQSVMGKGESVVVGRGRVRWAGRESVVGKGESAVGRGESVVGRRESVVGR